jgi:hypothetical protein
MPPGVLHAKKQTTDKNIRRERYVGHIKKQRDTWTDIEDRQRWIKFCHASTPTYDKVSFSQEAKNHYLSFHSLGPTIVKR